MSHWQKRTLRQYVAIGESVENGIPGESEAKALIELADRIRSTLSGWRSDVSRGAALCACIVLVGTEAGYENASDRAKFMARVSNLLGWAYDLGARAKAFEGSS